LLKSLPRARVLALSLTAVLAACQVPPGVIVSSDSGQKKAPAQPPLVVTATPAPQVVYRPGSRDDVEAKKSWEYAVGTVMGDVSSRVSDKVSALENSLTSERGAIADLRARLADMQWKNDAVAADYYTLVGGLNTQLQSGTTAGNPVLTERWNRAKEKLEELGRSTEGLSGLAADTAAQASRLSYLQENVRGAFRLSGAVEDDHKRLSVVEDGVNESIVAVNRLLTSVNDEIARRDSYLRAERLNMQTLSLSVASGELYGQNVSNALYRRAVDGPSSPEAFAGPGTTVPPSRRPLVIVRFDKPDVESRMRQPIYTAVSQALEKFPAARFDLVAVSTTEGNPARVALAATEAQKNGESVLRVLTQMGLPVERVSLNTTTAEDVANTEVRLYIR
jgi:hypothetical protein